MILLLAACSLDRSAEAPVSQSKEAEEGQLGGIHPASAPGYGAGAPMGEAAPSAPAGLERKA
ncbi:MAG: hypothetical protein ACK4YP_08230, partial [Myxococcota bacterium]